jgi:hypothetical protein
MRLWAWLRCQVDPDYQYKVWPPVYGTESWHLWQQTVQRRIAPHLSQADGMDAA